MGVLRHLRVIAPWFAQETAPSFVVADIALTCTITRAQTSLPISRLVGHTTLAGCKFPPFVCTMYEVCNNGVVFKGQRTWTHFPD
jgi:hypothetical protein